MKFYINQILVYVSHMAYLLIFWLRSIIFNIKYVEYTGCCVGSLLSLNWCNTISIKFHLTTDHPRSPT